MHRGGVPVPIRRLRAAFGGTGELQLAGSPRNTAAVSGSREEQQE